VAIAALEGDLVTAQFPNRESGTFFAGFTEFVAELG
jgi:hypothetical protein